MRKIFIRTVAFAGKCVIIFCNCSVPLQLYYFTIYSRRRAGWRRGGIMTESIPEEMSPLWDIYNDGFPDFLAELLEAEELQRLKKVGMHCGCEYSSFPLFRFSSPYTRWIHSVGAGLIVWHFTFDVKQSIAGLLHDIATPVFAHVVDFMKGDHLKQESTEEYTRKLIEESEGIQKVLHKYGLSTEDVADYHRYPIADNDSPGLSADRLEYTLGNFYCREKKSPGEIRRIYRNLTTVLNEEGIPELAFTSSEEALTFTLGSLDNSRMFTADEDRFCMQYLADLLRKAVEWGILSESDLYTTEEKVLDKLLQDERAAGLWEEYTRFSQIRSSAEPVEGIYCVNVPSKLRYIDPLVVQEGIPVRISKICTKAAEAVREYLHTDFDRWISVSGEQECKQ